MYLCGKVSTYDVNDVGRCRIVYFVCFCLGPGIEGYTVHNIEVYK
jgi:hypothetical protein